MVVSDFDGNTYNSIGIGDQCWMKKNLSTTHYSDGTAIPLVSSASDWISLVNTSKAYCYYDSSSTNAAIYGALYTWAAAMNGSSSSLENPSLVQGICPAGWHLPSDAEWKQLEVFLGMTQTQADNTGWRGTDQGGKLKETGTSHWLSPNTGATNSSGFTALPGGWRSSYSGNFFNIGEDNELWTASEDGSSYAFYRELSYNNTKIFRDYSSKIQGRSVRCIYDIPIQVYLPTVTTDSITSITSISASCHVNIIASGGVAITSRGACWNTTGNPTFTDSHTYESTGTGIFSSIMTGLAGNTTYYVRAYANNGAGTGYGNEVSFTTLAPVMPTVITNLISSISMYTAYAGGNITSDGGAAITGRGVCWNTSGNPTISDSLTNDGTGAGVFISSISSLTQTTIYYLRAYATNIVGTSYGNEMQFSTLPFSCGNSIVLDFEENAYNTFQIGNQCWMKNNLKTGYYSDGTAIPYISSTSAWDNLTYTDKAYCYYVFSETNAQVYGALYTWAAAMNGAVSSLANPSGVQGICPTGWHLPSDAEFKQLEIFLGMTQDDADSWDYRGTDQGGQMKETGTIHWNSPNTGATNSSGFTALPGGMISDYTFSNIGKWCRLWTSTEADSWESIIRVLNHNSVQVTRIYSNKNYGLSVRCLRDN
jgi:uncharacterized protein (TIGR02145 family)